MDRLALSDGMWERIAPLIIGRPDQKVSDVLRHGAFWGSVGMGPWHEIIDLAHGPTIDEAG